MDYASLIVAIHNDDYKTFCRILKRYHVLYEDDRFQILKTLCFFRKNKFLKKILEYHDVKLYPAGLELFELCLKRKFYSTAQMIIDNLRFTIHMQNELYNDYCDDIWSFAYFQKFREFSPKNKYKFLHKLILHIKLFLQKRITNNYLILEIIESLNIKFFENRNIYKIFTSI